MNHYFELGLPDIIESNAKYRHPVYDFIYVDDNGTLGWDELEDYRITINFTSHINMDKIHIYKKEGTRFVQLQGLTRPKFTAECYGGKTIGTTKEWKFLDMNDRNFARSNYVRADEVPEGWEEKRKAFEEATAKEIHKRMLRIYPHLRHSCDLVEIDEHVRYYMAMLLIPRKFAPRVMKIFKSNCR